NLPASIKNVNPGAFAACKSLISVKLPEEAWFDDAVFPGCTSLKTVEIPEGWLILPSSMFAGCVSLESPKLPAGMMNIGLNAFSGCTAMESIELPSDLQMIWSGAFVGCSSLRSVKCTSTEPPFLKDNVFSGIPSDATLYVPAASVGAYKSSSWGDYFKNIVPLN
ncbi:MAG: leucine-rich repeat domain-containing protein, partial [Muribaculaceae bacterium]|nr:leucine-rich repeat domain-containing protein [Muribaculaceae bacterium]